MSARVEVPITKEVLAWAIDESGLPASEIAAAADVDEARVQSWRLGAGRPSIGELRAVAARLHRQVATFLLPTPPAADDAPTVLFRHPMRRRRALNPDERRFIRRAGRLQSAHRWLAKELNRQHRALPRFGLSTDAAAAGASFRSLLGITTIEQFEWKSPTVAFDHWRAAVEEQGVIVLKYAMGEDSCRGFSLFDSDAPLVAVNTAWRTEARTFTLLHEVGHLVTGSTSACAQSSETSAGTEPTERWCEAFAAAALIPGESLVSIERVRTIAELARLADQFKVSLRAMAIRLIGAGKATWALYRAVPHAADKKKKAGGGAGRTLRELREDEFGWRGIDVFIDAARREVITESQALDYLDLPLDDFEQLAADAHLR